MRSTLCYPASCASMTESLFSGINIDRDTDGGKEEKESERRARDRKSRTR